MSFADVSRDCAASNDTKNLNLSTRLRRFFHPISFLNLAITTLIIIIILFLYSKCFYCE
jgi:hypothetical protein